MSINIPEIHIHKCQTCPCYDHHNGYCVTDEKTEIQIEEIPKICPLKNKLYKEEYISKSDVLDAFGHGRIYTSEEIQSIINKLHVFYI